MMSRCDRGPLPPFAASCHALHSSSYFQGGEGGVECVGADPHPPTPPPRLCDDVEKAFPAHRARSLSRCRTRVPSPAISHTPPLRPLSRQLRPRDKPQNGPPECDRDEEGDAQMTPCRLLTDVATEGYRIKPDVATFPAQQQRNLSLLSEWQCDRRTIVQPRRAKRSAPNDDVDEQLAAAARFMNL